MARTEVTKRVTAYIKEAKLQVKDNRRRFVPDAKLGSILGKLDTVTKGKDGKTDSEKGYTYFNLQKYLSPQFPKNTNAHDRYHIFHSKPLVFYTFWLSQLMAAYCLSLS